MSVLSKIHIKSLLHFCQQKGTLQICSLHVMLSRKLFQSQTLKTGILNKGSFRKNWRCVKENVLHHKVFKLIYLGTSLVILWLELHASNSGSLAQGTRTHMVPLRVLMLQLKILQATMETEDPACCNQDLAQPNK